ncbi:MAG: nitroreductase family protein [Oscillospiraceae bacterium]|nr:nitroreductase family protein [Oscillospiraceae bacterium]
MEFMKVVKDRYSCRSYDGRKVEPDALAEILEAGRLAPTAKNLQEQRIYVVESAEGLAKIDKLTRCRYNAGTVLIVAFDKNNVFTYPGGKRDSGVEDASIVTTHMMLAAKNVGVDSTWLNLIDPDEVKAAFNLPENEEVLCLLNLGYADENAEPSQNHSSRKAIAETVKRI